MLYASADLSEDHGGEKKLIEEDVGSDKVRARMNDKELLGSMYVFLLAGRGAFDFLSTTSLKLKKLNDLIINRYVTKYPGLCFHPLGFASRQATETLRSHHLHRSSWL